VRKQDIPAWDSSKLVSSWSISYIVRQVKVKRKVLSTYRHFCLKETTYLHTSEWAIKLCVIFKCIFNEVILYTVIP
jgi:hypothetical protein